MFVFFLARGAEGTQALQFIWVGLSPALDMPVLNLVASVELSHRSLVNFV